MEFNEDLGQYVYEVNGIIFAWDEEPEEDYEELAKTLSDNYYSHLDSIIELMMPDLQEVYENVSDKDVKEKLGRPIIDYDNGQVTYIEQTFDDIHIFTFEFLDDEFEELQFFSIDG